MKCVCPMGGDRTCPDDCLLAVWANLPADDRKKRRKPIAEQLYKQGFSQEQIATQLGVSQRQISTDLRSLEVTSKLPPRASKRGRKGEGRPKGSKNRTTPAAPAQDPVRVSATPQEWEEFKRVEDDAGRKAAEVLGAVVKGVEIDPATLSLSAQQKLDAAIRQHQRKLDLSFQQRVLDEVKKRIDEIVLPHWKKQIDQAQELYKHRRGAMDKATFNKIRRGLHPDSRNSISDKVLGEAFDTFMSSGKILAR